MMQDSNVLSGAHALLLYNTSKATVYCFTDMLDERERKLHYVRSASLAYEDGSVFMSGAICRMAVRQWLTAFWSLCHMNRRMEPSAS